MCPLYLLFVSTFTQYSPVQISEFQAIPSLLVQGILENYLLEIIGKILVPLLL